MGRKQKKSSWPLVLIGLVLLVGAAVFGFSHFGGSELLSSLNPAESGSRGAAKSGASSSQVSQYVGPTYDDPVPESMMVSQDVLDMITTKTARTEAVSVGGIDFGIETNNIVGSRPDGSFELAGGRVVHPVSDFDNWNLDEALEAAGYGSSADEFAELTVLSLYDQHEVLLTTTEQDGLQYDYDFSAKAALALKEQLVGSGRRVFKYSLGYRNVIQVGQATDREGARVIVYFPSDNIGAVDVTGHAQESIYWLVTRMLEPDYETATANLAKTRALQSQADVADGEDDLAGEGDGAVEVTEPVEEERL